MSDHKPQDMHSTEPLAEQAPDPALIAPLWHTVLLIAGILAISIGGRQQLVHLHQQPNRLVTYGATAVVELLMLGWVAFGLRLKKVSLRSLFGDLPAGMRGFVLDLGIAFVFWIGSLVILGTLGIMWSGVEYAIEHGHAPNAAHPIEPTAAEKQTVRTLEGLAPSNAVEVACWIALCFVAGFIEETVFRGYLQQQCTALARGNIIAGVTVSALLFGAAHGYQGARNMTLLAVFGVLFSLLAVFRRNLRAGILAHGWHDMIAGVALAALRSHHLV
jgi:membrane protease YdiL (CAAX protease family)